MIESRVPTFFWPEAVATSVYLLNHLPTKPIGFKTPVQELSRQTVVPSALSLKPRIFGCSGYVHIPKSNRTKLDLCAIKCVFIGYGIHQKGYRCYHPSTKRLYTMMDCDFLE